MKKYILFLFAVLGFTFMFNIRVNAFSLTIGNRTFDETSIFEQFKSIYEDFSIKEFPYITCTHRYSNAHYLSCNASSQALFDNYIYYTKTAYGEYQYKNNEVTASVITFTYTASTDAITSTKKINTVLPYYTNSVISLSIYYASSHCKTYTNYNPSLLPSFDSSYDSEINVLDFFKYSIDYSLSDKKIFTDDPNYNYREECFSGGTLFSVYPNKNNPELKEKKENNKDEFNIYSGLYFFGNTDGLQRGTYKHLTIGTLYQDAMTLTLGVKFTQLHDITSNFILLKDDDLLQSRYSDVKDALGNYDYINGTQNSYFYDNLSKLINTTYAPFTYYENALGDYYFDMFYYNPTDPNSSVCVFIPKYFDVTFINLNEHGGMIADIETPGGTINLLPIESITGNDSTFEGLFSSVNNFISKISTPLELINGYIYDLYNSMPFLLKLFIISAVTLLVTKFIIGLVIK